MQEGASLADLTDSETIYYDSTKEHTVRRDYPRGRDAESRFQDEATAITTGQNAVDVPLDEWENPAVATDPASSLTHRSAASQHWASAIPLPYPYTTFAMSFQRSLDPSRVHGSRRPESIKRLRAEGFVLVYVSEIEIGKAEFYWRPTDSRARILLRCFEELYCMPLTTLKLKRNKTILELYCFNREHGKFDLWAELIFVQYEYTVLVYSIFAGMKAQDGCETPFKDYFDGEELKFFG
jgi:hypothetical protein